MPDIAAGAPEPIGVVPVVGGVNVAVVAPDAMSVWFCVFDGDEERRHRLPARTGDVWHGRVPGIGVGTRYGLRADGPWDPARGHRFNPARLVVDPWATALDAPFTLHDTQFDTGVAPDTADSAPFMPKAVVGIALPPAPPLAQAGPEVIQELHVRGFTRRHPDIPAPIRGTFAGLAHPAAIAHLKALGITAVELMPCAAWIDERHLPPLGLSNHWGYNPVTFLAPDPRLAPGGMAEVRGAIIALHEAGLRVILDVVLNHTGEGDALGPTLSLRGLADSAFYRRDAHGALVNDSGCGNTLALDRPWPLRLAMDALRHWALAGVDGFRLDLATALARRADGFDPHAPLIAAMRQDPILRTRRIIAEPWDLGAGGYRLGEFPPGWGEWNDRFRDDVRRFWRGDAGMLGPLATRLAGSADVFGQRHRGARDSINFVTAHDGFTLADLVSYTDRKNQANGEDGRDGTAANHSWNGGAEGPTDDPAILARRAADARALLATLLLARGTPMLGMGDEAGRSQGGNNNAYAQDNATSWLDWATLDRDLMAFTARLVALRAAHPALHDATHLTGGSDDSDAPDVAWLALDGTELAAAAWTQERSLAMVLLTNDDRVLVCVHGADAPAELMPPSPRWGHAWRLAADSADPARTGPAVAPVALAPRSVVLLIEVPSRAPRADDADPALLARLASAAGIETTWRDLDGKAHAVPRETVLALLQALSLPAATAAQARDSLGRALPRSPDHAAAGTCYLPEDLLAGARRFGLMVQTYALRRAEDQGIGDYTALAEAAAHAARHCAAWLGISPPHALMPVDRERASPYQPSDRRFLEPALLDVTDLAGLEDLPPVRAALAEQAPVFHALRAPGLVDYSSVWRAKSAVLDAAWSAFTPEHPAWEEFASFARAGGTALARFAAHTAIAEQQATTDTARWPPGLRDAEAGGLAGFITSEPRAIGAQAFRQFLCERQFRAAGCAGAGLYRDLAVGCAPDGAEAWAQPASFLRGFSVGAPPDRFAPGGQVWGLPPPAPAALPADFATLVAANMRHAAALRIDHVMAMRRLFVVPQGAGGADGCYLNYPFRTLLAALCAASRDAGCAVVGEDLGTVPGGLRAALHAARVLSYRVLWFERNGDGFVPPAAWPAQATACVSTHDLPTLAGWWDGADIREREALGLGDAATGLAKRAAERRALLQAMGRAGDEPEFSPALAGAVHRHLAAAPSAMLLVQAEDLAGETVAVNLPGTDRQRPNWRRRLPLETDAIFATSPAAAILAAVRCR